MRTTVNPKTKKTVRGQYLPRTTHSTHQQVQHEADVAAQTESLSNMTLLRTMASTNANSREVAPTASPVTELLARGSKQPIPTIDHGIPDGAATLDPGIIDRNREDVLHLGRTIEQRISAFTVPQTLKFKSSPKPHTPYVTQLTTHAPVNTGVCALDPARHPDSAGVTALESWMVQALDGLNVIDCCGIEPLIDQRRQYGDKILAILKRLDQIKKLEWERQSTSVADKSISDSREPAGAFKVDTRALGSQESTDMDSLPLICIFIVAVLHLLCRVSRDRCNFVLVALRYLLDKALGSTHPVNEWYRKRAVDSVPGDVRTVLSHFNIEPPLASYVCCPKCCALYPQGPLDKEDAYPEYCENRETSGSNMCGARLRTTRFISGKAYSKPVRTYLYQDFPSWLARLLCRPGFEALLDKPLFSVTQSPPDVYRDVWDAKVIREFVGPDGQLFFHYRGKEARLLFSLSYDNFNPYHNKQAGKKVAVGSIFMVCLNLPPEERYKFENMYLAGIVPGPKQPTITETNHFVRPLVDQLDVLWKRGYFLSQTPEHEHGRLVRGVLIPLIADLHAARQMGAFGSYGSTFFCTFCGLLFQDIEEVNPENWPPIRTCAEHRECAKTWLDATTHEEREAIFSKSGVRWSEFLRLEYWDPSLFTVFDSMHGWYLNAFENHVRTILGVDHKQPSGDGSFVGKRPKGPKPTSKELSATLRAIQADRRSVLESTNKPVLYWLCEYRQLRRAGTCLQMRRTLAKFYNQNPSLLKEDISTLEAAVDKAPSAIKKDTALGNACARLMKASDANIVNDTKYLTSCSKPNLLQLCKEWNISTTPKDHKAELAEKLIRKQMEDPRQQLGTHSLDSGMAVLGIETVKEINADMARTVLPSWVASSPSKFQASEHGKLKADEWRTTVLIRLAITLPRVWGPLGGRHKLMLDNFMNLAGAVIIGSSLAVIHNPSAENGATKSTSDLYCETYQAYLQGVIDLFPTATLKPNMHLAYHIGELLENYGPVHSWRCNVFERFIGLIQNIPTNMRFGELEQTFMRSFCMAANLKAFVADSQAEAIRDLREAFQAAFSGDTQGLLLYDLLGLESMGSDIEQHEQALTRAPRKRLDIGTVQLLADCLNARDTNLRTSPLYVVSTDRTADCIPLDPHAWSLTQFRQGGIWYRRVRPTESAWVPGEDFSPHRDSHVLVKTCSDISPMPCSIQDIFAHRHIIPGRVEPAVETFCIIRRYQALLPKHEEFDHWRKYPVAAGKLYYDELQERAEIVDIKDIVAHFAKTPFQSGELPGLERPCIHVLPLNWHDPQLLTK